MAGNEIVAWTDVGGQPCCCGACPTDVVEERDGYLHFLFEQDLQMFNSGTFSPSLRWQGQVRFGKAHQILIETQSKIFLYEFPSLFLRRKLPALTGDSCETGVRYFVKGRSYQFDFTLANVPDFFDIPTSVPTVEGFYLEIVMFFGAFSIVQDFGGFTTRQLLETGYPQGSSPLNNYCPFYMQLVAPAGNSIVTFYPQRGFQNVGVNAVTFQGASGSYGVEIPGQAPRPRGAFFGDPSFGHQNTKIVTQGDATSIFMPWLPTWYLNTREDGGSLIGILQTQAVTGNIFETNNDFTQEPLFVKPPMP